MNERRILLVEDNPDDELLTLRALSKSKITGEIDVVSDGAEALEYLFSMNGSGEYRELPGLILLDLKLPKVDGLDVLRAMRDSKRTRFVPVVVLTTSDEQKDIVESYRLGANSFIRKPVDFELFAQSIMQLGRYWLTLNQAPPVGE